ncbi:ATP-binding protein [Candidatus Gottesmanbacteria bacterium]|nr:ATP-binding protein [Candidatus Gottesmanbacteria bacterium]
MGKNEIFAILRDWNFWFQEMETGITRNLYLSSLRRLLPTSNVLVITGVRRSGKSFLMRQLAKSLTEEGVKKEEILIINFEDPRFIDLNVNLLSKIYEAYLEILRPARKPYIFLDEVQKVKGWESWVRSIQERQAAKIVISGSNSQILSRELGTLLTGRHLDITVYPLAFDEFLSFRGVTIEKEQDLLTKEIIVKGLLREYLTWGGFPEVVLREPKKEILLTYFEDISLRDLAKRYKIIKTEKLRQLAKFYLSNFASPITFNALEKSLGLTADTIEKFSGYLENAYLTIFLKRFSYKTREQEKSPRKVYAIDTGLANTVGFQFSENWGRLAENLVSLALRSTLAEIYYWKDEKGQEVDFIIKEGLKATKAIQVCWQMEDPKTTSRELKGLLKALKELELSEGIVITEEEEREELIGDKKIKIIPLWKWLIKKEYI